MEAISELTRERLILLAKQQVNAGLLDPITLAPLISIETFHCCDTHNSNHWRRVRIKNHVFDLPTSMSRANFLAAGGYGCVIECWHKGQRVAVKKVPVPGKSNEDDALRLLREVVVLRKAREEKQHSLCQVLDVYANSDCTNAKQLRHIYMVMPLYSPGCLEDVVVSNHKMFHTIASHTLQAIQWLHAHGILHRDIKRENIFYDEASDRAVLGDMGNCRRWCEGKMTGKEEVGTKCYLAPEFLARQEYSFASDIWALGVCWYEMLCLEDGQDTMFPHHDATDRERQAKQKALCYSVNPAPGKRAPRRTPENIAWAELTWSRVEEMEKRWEQPQVYTGLLRRIFAFDPARRAPAEDLFGTMFAKPMVEIVPMAGVGITEYEEARTFLFNMRTIVPDDPSSSTACPSDSASCASHAVDEHTPQENSYTNAVVQPIFPVAVAGGKRPHDPVDNVPVDELPKKRHCADEQSENVWHIEKSVSVF